MSETRYTWDNRWIIFSENENAAIVDQEMAIYLTGLSNQGVTIVYDQEE